MATMHDNAFVYISDSTMWEFFESRRAKDHRVAMPFWCQALEIIWWIRFMIQYSPDRTSYFSYAMNCIELWIISSLFIVSNRQLILGSVSVGGSLSFVQRSVLYVESVCVSRLDWLSHTPSTLNTCSLIISRRCSCIAGWRGIFRQTAARWRDCGDCVAHANIL